MQTPGFVESIQRFLAIICRVCCNGIIICVLKLHDGRVAELAFGFEPVDIEEPPISPVQDCDPCGSSLQIRWSMAAMKIANRVGAMMHPCLIPVFSVQVSDSMPLLLSTVADMSSCSNLKMQMYLLEQPYLDSVLHGSWQSKVTKAFVRSMKAIYNGCLCPLYFFFLFCEYHVRCASG